MAKEYDHRSHGSNNPYDRKETEGDRQEAAHHRRLKEIYGDDGDHIKEHELPHWKKD